MGGPKQLHDSCPFPLAIVRLSVCWFLNAMNDLIKQDMIYKGGRPGKSYMQRQPPSPLFCPAEELWWRCCLLGSAPRISSARGSVAFLGSVSSQPVFPLPSKCSSRSHGDYVKPVFFFLSFWLFRHVVILGTLKMPGLGLALGACLPKPWAQLLPVCGYTLRQAVLLSPNSLPCVLHFCFLPRVDSGSWPCACAQPAPDAWLSLFADAGAGQEH